MRERENFVDGFREFLDVFPFQRIGAKKLWKAFDEWRGERVFFNPYMISTRQVLFPYSQIALSRFVNAHADEFGITVSRDKHSLVFMMRK